MQQLQKEVEKYRDFLLTFFKAAYKHFEAEYYVKADDDIYLRPGPVITDPKLKWYEKSGHLIGNEYFLHAYGPIYVLSADIVASLAVARNNSFRMFSNEDVTIGSWMLAMDVKHEDNRAICDPQCTSTSIAVWDIPKCSGI
ncbi:Probable beta-1,3-galactosyltransferase 12 [Linum perenne]